MEKHPIHNPRIISRRNFLSGVGSAATLAVMAREGINYNEEAEIMPEAVENTADVENEEVESIEQIAEDLPSPVFDQVLDARTIEAGGLRRDQVVFVDSFGRQLTEVFDLTESVGLSPEEMTWRFNGGKPAGIPGTWIKEQKNYISEQSGVPIADIDMLSVYLDLVNDDQEYFTSRVEMVFSNAIKVVPGDTYGRDVLTIIREETRFEHIPPDIAEQLNPYIIGIACEESRLDVAKTSSQGAVGFMQIMPKIFESYKIQHKQPNLNPRNLLDQLPVGLQHIEVSYEKLMENLDIELAYITRVYFNGNVASMEKYFLVPVIINSYNAGQDRMINVVQWFLDNYPDPQSTAELLEQAEPLSGYDVFLAMTHQCAVENGVDRFGSDASTYVAKVMGWTRAFSEFEQNSEQQYARN